MTETEEAEAVVEGLARTEIGVDWGLKFDADIANARFDMAVVSLEKLRDRD